MSFSKAVVKNRVLILIIAFLLLIPSVFGYIGTRVNYDMLDYLPKDMETVIGQDDIRRAKEIAGRSGGFSEREDRTGRARRVGHLV